MKRLAGDENAVVGIQRVAEIVQVEVPVRTIHIRVRHIDDAVRVRPPNISGIFQNTTR